MDDQPQTEPSVAVSAPAHSGSVKETIESILLAFILAFIFRAFVVEAFVIPTGSMAPTLLGAHMRFTCSDCGYYFTVNYSGVNDGDDVSIPSVSPKAYSVYCPNCGFKLPKDATTHPQVHYGDRILVLKYLYLLQEPHRWDVVVFKSPDDRKYLYQTNYIKRLIGKPGESILVLDGDVYIANTTSDTLLPQDFTIQRKPRSAQDALWRIVFDNNHYPTGLVRADGTLWHQPWTPKAGESGWDIGKSQSDGRIFRFNNLKGAQALVFDPNASPNPRPLTDWLAYDQVHNDRQGPRSKIDTSGMNSAEAMTDNPVSDLRLSFYYDRSDGDGPLRLQLGKLDRVFIAEIYPDRARLLMKQDGQAERELIPPTPIKLTVPAKIDFQNVDYQVTLRLNDQDVLQTTPQMYAPDVGGLLQMYRDRAGLPSPTVRIMGENQVCRLSHVSLWRDVYYINRSGGLRWAMPDDFPNRIARLQRDEYFVMGDNSPVSGDARYWTTAVDLPDEDLYAESGRVPGRFMLGKAFFVYWPAGFRPLPSGPSFVPNFGEMRFIH